MTEKEMTEIFTVMMLAYPNAECFKGGMDKLLPTVKLWHRCCMDMDCWTGHRAAYKLITECKYPPTISEFLSKAEAITAELDGKATECYMRIVNAVRLHGERDAYQYAGDAGQKVIDALGGVENLFDSTGKVFRMDDIVSTYIQQARALPSMPGRKQIGGATA